ncbi:MMPL family transporter [Enterovirga sp.]|uniref:MMPL family transporter n=1 Tax=Enterovirga sp. TaxID=2026350 RepID=UPI00261C0339|nr:MMPL family transporter [Enterovirga sp.]MDB5592697.1 hopanoid biosynthesis associated transporter HpnN [Enterovirga sp.]
MPDQPVSSPDRTALPPVPASDPSFMAVRLAEMAVRRPWLVILVSLLLSVAGLYVTATRFAITTETDQLLHTEDAWAKHKMAYEKAFPQFTKSIVAVIDGDTPELAEAAAARLTAALAEPAHPAIRRAWRPDGGPWFDRHGLLLLPVDQVRSTTEALKQQSGTLLGLSGDPTLRGLLRLIQAGAQQGELENQGSFVDRLGDVVERVLRGERASLSWQTLMSGRPVEPRELRRFVLVDPVLDFKALEPAAVATARIRSAAVELGLVPERGVRVRLTGAAPLADEEFATVRDGAPLHLGLTVIAIAVILYLALKSGRVIFAVLATTAAGLVITIAAGLLMVGRFNVISVAVAALFLGLGVDFGIQVAVRYRDERHKLDHIGNAVRLTARGIGWSLTLAALSLLAGFFSFLPTSFRGVSELGLITGVGMIIAFVLSLTLLPALIVVLRPGGEPDTVESPALAVVDHWILRHRKAVIVASSALVVAGLPLLFRLEFDANPMHLRSEKTEGVATFLDLTRQKGQTPNTLTVLAPSVDAIPTLSERLAALPEVAQVVSVLTFVPERQEEKLALVKGAAEEYEALLDPQQPEPAPAPTDQELVEALRTAAGALSKAGPAGGPNARLADALSRLAEAGPDRREAAAQALVGGLPALFDRVRSILSPEPVTVATLPAQLRRDWVTPEGQARIEVSPAGDANDNAVLERFSEAVRTVSPATSGPPIDVVEAGRIIVKAFVVAGALALAAIFLMLTLALRRPMDVALTLGPLVIATILTLEAAYLIGMPLNLANIIALPLMLAVGVNFHIYYMIAWRNGVSDMLASSLTRAIFYSALVTGIAFGSLWLSNHPGTASMGKLLTISLVFTLLAAFVIVPAFLGPPRPQTSPDPEHVRKS